MSYTEKIVQPGETVRYHSRVHWIIYVRGIVIILIGVIIAVALQQLDSNLGPWPSRVVLAIGLVLGGLSLLGAWWRRLTTEVAVTENRIVYKRGFIRRHTFEMNMSKVESVHVGQSMFGRMFNYGDIVIRGVGSSFEPLRTISRPLEFRNFVGAD